MNQDILDLIQGEVDGVNTPADTLRLQQICAQDSGVQAELDSAIEVVQIVQTIAHRQPPASFHSQVMNSLPANPSWMSMTAKNRAQGIDRSASRTISRSWTSLFRLPAKPSLTLAYGLAVGAIGMFAIMSALVTEPTIGEIEGVAGTMAPISTKLFSEEVTTPIGPIILDANQRSGDIDVNIRGAWTPDTQVTIKIENPDQVIFEKTFIPEEN